MTSFTQEAKREAEGFLNGRRVPRKAWAGLLQRAQKKRADIIRSEGDAAGERLKPWYLGLLMADIFLEERIEKHIQKTSKRNEQRKGPLPSTK